MLKQVTPDSKGMMNGRQGVEVRGLSFDCAQDKLAQPDKGARDQVIAVGL
jgi:hypothetical protein